MDLVDDPTIALARTEIPSANAATYFDHAAIGPISRTVRDAMVAMADEHLAAGAQLSWRAGFEPVRAQVAALVGSTPEHIAFTQNTSSGLALVATGLDWQAGDNVVLPELEFPSNSFPWTNLERLGVEVRRVAAPGGTASLDDVAGAIDGRTRAAAISYVQYSNGFRYDLAAFGDLCQQRGVLSVVDGTQAIGALTIDVDAAAIDLLAVSCHKWMLGPHGIAFAHCSDAVLERARPEVVGWLSVRDPFAFDGKLDFPPTAARYEAGTENLLGIVGLGAAVDLIDRLDAEWIEQRILGLTDHLCDGLEQRGFRLISERGRTTSSGIVVFAHRRIPTPILHQRLTDAGVRCSVRGGGIRFSPHHYNTVEEIDAALAVFAT